MINNGGKIADVSLSLAGLPGNWSYTLKSGNYNIRQISVLPGEKRSCNLNVEVPLQVNKENYRFRLTAGDSDVLPLVVTVSEKGTFQTTFTSKQANMEGHSATKIHF